MYKIRYEQKIKLRDLEAAFIIISYIYQYYLLLYVQIITCYHGSYQVYRRRMRFKKNNLICYSGQKCFDINHENIFNFKNYYRNKKYPKYFITDVK